MMLSWGPKSLTALLGACVINQGGICHCMTPSPHAVVFLQPLSQSITQRFSANQSAAAEGKGASQSAAAEDTCHTLTWMKLNSRQLRALLTEGMDVMASRESRPRLMTPKEMYISTLHTSSSFQEFSTLAWTCRREGKRGLLQCVFLLET